MTLRSAVSLLTLPLLLLFGCDSSGSNSGNSDSEPDNNPPVIEKINVNPATPNANQPNNDLTAVATDPDGDDLTYAWSASEGRLDPPTGNPVDWDAPSEPGEYKIKCTVNDGKVTTTDSVTVTVEPQS